MRSRFLWPVLAALVLPVALGGCNAFEAFYGEPEAAVDLLHDAQSARQKGDLGRAVTLLESAHEREPDNPAVRAELVQTKLEQSQIDVFTLRSLASYFQDLTSGVASATRTATPAARHAGGQCTAPGLDTGTPLDPTAFTGYQKVSAARADLDEMFELLTGGKAPVVPAEILDAQLCDVLDLETGQSTSDASAVVARLRAQGLRDADIDAAYANFAVIVLARAYLDVFVNSDIDGLAFFSRNKEIGFCSSVPVAEAEAVFRAQTYRVARAVYALDVRAQASGSQEAKALAGQVADVLQQINAFAPICTR